MAVQVINGARYMSCPTLLLYELYWFLGAIQGITFKALHGLRFGLPEVTFSQEFLPVQLNLTEWACCRSYQPKSIGWQGLEDGPCSMEYPPLGD